MKLLRVILSSLLMLTILSCDKDGEPGFEQYYDNRDEGIAFLAANELKDGVEVTSSGLQYEVVEDGVGEPTAISDNIKFLYTLKLIDGTVLDSNIDNEISDIYYSQVNLIWEQFLKEGLQLMNVGSIYTFYSPHHLAYGQLENGSILPYSAIICEVELIENFEPSNASKETIEVTDSGLQYEVIEEGAGEQPDSESEVTVHYHGTTLNGVVFDSSVVRGTPSEFYLNQVINGWTEGLQLMNVGSKYKFYIPYDLAYGENGITNSNGIYIINPYALLVFEVELLEILK